MLKPDPQPLSMGPTESATGGTELATFDRPRSDRPVQLGLVADPHVPVDDTEYQKLFAPTTMLERVVADATRREVDYLFSLGDLTKDGAPAEYEVLDDVLEALDVPFASVPGNHDVPKEFDSHDSLPVSRFADRYTPEGIPFAIDLADLTAVGIDSASVQAVSASHDGYVPESQVAWLDDVLDGARDILVLVHHNLPGAIDQYHENRQISGTEPGCPQSSGNPTISSTCCHATRIHSCFPVTCTSRGWRGRTHSGRSWYRRPVCIHRGISS